MTLQNAQKERDWYQEERGRLVAFLKDVFVYSKDVELRAPVNGSISMQISIDFPDVKWWHLSRKRFLKKEIKFSEYKRFTLEARSQLLQRCSFRVVHEFTNINLYGSKRRRRYLFRVIVSLKTKDTTDYLFRMKNELLWTSDMLQEFVEENS